MELIPRDDYLDWIGEFQDKPLVKVLTGLRRSGKSTLPVAVAPVSRQDGGSP